MTDDQNQTFEWPADTIIERTHANLITLKSGGKKLAEIEVPTMANGDEITVPGIKFVSI